MKHFNPSLRRDFLKWAGGSLALGALPLSARAMSGAAKAQVVIIGGGFGGATAAKYIRLLSRQNMQVMLIEPDAQFISCPLSNLVLSGATNLASLTRSYDLLQKKFGVTVVKARAKSVDTQAKTISLDNYLQVSYDKLIVSPGVELMMDKVQGLSESHDQGLILQAWKAGPETLALRRQLEAMPDGGVFAITIPEAPYRCPPGPYERACHVAWYFKTHKPKSKVLVLDENPDITSKAALFKKVWADLYPGIVEYRPLHKLLAVSGSGHWMNFEVQGEVKADVINALPPMRAGLIAQAMGLNNKANQRWCGVDFKTFAAIEHKDVHVLGDAVQSAPLMPKSGHMANSHAKVAASAIVSELMDLPVNSTPMLNNTCYSFVDDQRVIHVASVHEYIASENTYKVVPGSGGLSSGPTELEGQYAQAWAHNIWADMLGA